MSDKPYRGATVSQTGVAFFRKCDDCKRLLAANSLSWGIDYPGDKAGQATFRVICPVCAKRRKEGR